VAKTIKGAMRAAVRKGAIAQPAHPTTRLLSDGVLRYEPVPGEGVEYEKGDVSISVHGDRFRVLDEGQGLLSTAADLADCFRAAALESQAKESARA